MNTWCLGTCSHSTERAVKPTPWKKCNFTRDLHNISVSLGPMIQFLNDLIYGLVISSVVFKLIQQLMINSCTSVLSLVFEFICVCHQDKTQGKSYRHGLQAKQASYLNINFSWVYSRSVNLSFSKNYCVYKS